MINTSKLIMIALLIGTIGVLSPLSGQWSTKNIIDDALNTATIVAVGDLDGDTDLDVVATAEGINQVVWYQNNNFTWDKDTIDNDLDVVVGCGIADIDGDDTLDVIAAGHGANSLVWYENNHLTWTKHVIDTSLSGAEFLVCADVDRDDDMDVVAIGYDGEVAWYENSNLQWLKHTIDGNLGGNPTSVDVGDLDGDDTLDVAVVANNAHDLVWYQNRDVGLSWTKYTIDSNLGGAWHLDIADINNDDENDIVATGYDVNDVVWYDNNNLTWDKYTIDGNLNGARIVTIADFDGDLDLDIAAIGLQADDVVWYENEDLTWTKYVIDGNLNGANMIYAADMDNDNFMDLVVAAYYANSVVWYTNQITNIEQPSVKKFTDFQLRQNYPNPFNPSTTIKFSLPKSEYVELKVYNPLGKEVSTLVSNKLNQGNHTYNFDGSNLASGVYYYQLIAGDYREVKKMILIK